MTSKTKGYIIDDELELVEIYDFVKQHLDPNAKLNEYANRFGEVREVAIYFHYKNDERRLFCMDHNGREFSKNGAKHRMIIMDLDFWGSSVEIMKGIVSFFGGYLEENDCDEEDAYHLDADKKVTIGQENIIKITRSELNRRLGGTVVIIEDDEAE